MEANLSNIHMKELKTYNHNFFFKCILQCFFTSFIQVFS
jgi:hypothetical protein